MILNKTQKKPAEGSGRLFRKTRGEACLPNIIVKRGKIFYEKGTYRLMLSQLISVLDSSFLVCLYYRQTLWDHDQKHVKVP